MCVFSLACLCFDSPKGPTVLCHVWELSCHEYDPINTDHIYECWEVFLILFNMKEYVEIYAAITKLPSETEPILGILLILQSRFTLRLPHPKSHRQVTSFYITAYFPRSVSSPPSSLLLSNFPKTYTQIHPALPLSFSLPPTHTDTLF